MWGTREHGVLVRYCDDAVVMCRSRQQAEAALARLRQLLADLGLEPKEVKTRIVRLEVGDPGFDFLGFHHRLVRSRGIRGRKGVTFLARWPSAQHVPQRGSPAPLDDALPATALVFTDDFPAGPSARPAR
ncbi:MAG TPA: reverse transcriptase domain-containing protein [Pseudonocardiaceae bacterium]|nr:reverse transcriptase domain-containing protein [Pseudonocardiaceae bacterium]